MKQNKILSLTCLSIALTFMVVVESNAQILPTKLQMTIVDGSGNKVEGAMVSIYTSEDDYRVGQNAVFTGVTNKKGKLTFKEAKTVQYFIEVKKGELTNIGEGVQTGPLTKGKFTKVSITIE